MPDLVVFVKLNSKNIFLFAFFLFFEKIKFYLIYYNQ